MKRQKTHFHTQFWILELEEDPKLYYLRGHRLDLSLKHSVFADLS